MAVQIEDRKEKCPLCDERQITAKHYPAGDADLKCKACGSTWYLPAPADVDFLLDEKAYEIEPGQLAD